MLDISAQWRKVLLSKKKKVLLSIAYTYLLLKSIWLFRTSCWRHGSSRPVWTQRADSLVQTPYCSRKSPANTQLYWRDDLSCSRTDARFWDKIFFTNYERIINILLEKYFKCKCLYSAFITSNRCNGTLMIQYSNNTLNQWCLSQTEILVGQCKW